MLDDDDVFDPLQYAPPTSALDELRAIPHWVSWKYFLRPGTTKPTKPPVDPNTGGAGSHSDPKTWAAYEKACWRTRFSRLAGVGFVLTDGDGLTGIDLDACRNAETGELEPWAAEIIELAETYAEVSPSGTGVRLLARGKVTSATKCDAAHVEIYGSLRYLTITGNHIDETPEDIRPAPQTIEQLLARVAAHTPKAVTSEQGNQPKHQQIVRPRGGDHRRENQPQSDGKSFFRAVNERALANLDLWVTAIFPSAKFQPSTGAFRVTSKSLGRQLQEDIALAPTGIVDFGVADMGDPQQGKRTAIDMAMEWGGAEDATAAAKWLCDKLGVTAEALGWRDEDAAIAELAAQLGRTLVEDEDGTLHDPETGEVFERPAMSAAARMDERLTRPPGLIGEIVDWICATSRRPNRALALGPAIATVGAICGRYWAGPTRSGTNFYLALLAPTGADKEHLVRSPGRMLEAIGLSALIGPKEFMSQTAIQAHVLDTPVSLCAQDEFGAFMARVHAKRASSFERGISKELRELWGLNFNSTTTAAYASRKASHIYAASLTILGASNPDEFWAAFEGADILNGFLNRFLMLEMDDRPPPKKPELADPSIVPSSIIAGLLALHAGGDGVESGTSAQCLSPEARASTWKPVIVDWESEAVERIWLEYEEEVIERHGQPGASERMPYYARAAQNAIRLATIQALARLGVGDPKVTAQDVKWGIEVAEFSAQTMLRGAGLYISETDHQKSANNVLRIITNKGGFASYRDISQALKSRLKSRDLQDVIKTLLDGGFIVEEVVKSGKGGHAVKKYRLGGGMD
ncbi:DUF3987 domain-containing protein [Methylosinus sp. PW1]|uniref:DUF3987 domain-containing protein n=1 Tax=Methylosinus sp. PW1 TaxID=107636 RepID=UPI00068B1032|nr:DUF3987 domain-containing protein [Methylosinus sp. PW1]